MKICFEFKKGRCKHGDKCCFRHVGAEELPQKLRTEHEAPPAKLCYAFQNTGWCKFGDRCRYAHHASKGGGRGRVSADIKQGEVSTNIKHGGVSADIAQFLRHLGKQVQRQKVEVDLDLWHRSWLVAGALKPAAARHLLRALMLLPASAAVQPPPRAVLAVVERAVASADDAQTLEVAADVLEHRLVATPDMRDQVADVGKAAQKSLVALLQIDVLLASRCGPLLARYPAIVERCVATLDAATTTREEEEEEEEVVPWLGWRAATVGWLQSGAWLDAPPLQKGYESVDDYVETLGRLVTMLTFYWGAGAVFPKCHQHQHDMPCNQPLLAVARSNKSRVCGQRLPGGRGTCGEAAKVCCARHGHDAACARCLRRLQAPLVGTKGPRASTDVYDAVVVRETIRRDGQIFILNDLRSRKPPTVETNWRTTYRLQCSALVGVVRLGASGVPLCPDQKIAWAEVVPLNPADAASDYIERKKGRIALRLLTTADLSTLQPSLDDGLDEGICVAVVDLQVFVPEVISVLSTITDPALVDHLRRIPFAEHLISFDDNNNNKNKGVVPSGISGAETVENTIADALRTSEIDVLCRFPAPVMEDLIAKISTLCRSANLYGTQLDAFAQALRSSLHCTQGPPGTGKSYLGVQLIFALDIIRDFARKNGISLGPIVLLSYKNHALDEMLVDVLRLSSDRTLGTALIRCGNPENQLLSAHRESAVEAEKMAQRELKRRLDTVRYAQKILRDWRELTSELRETVDDGAAFQKLSAWKSRRRRRAVHSLVRARERLVGTTDVGLVATVVSALELFANVQEYFSSQKDPVDIIFDPKETSLAPKSKAAYDLLEKLARSPAVEKEGPATRTLLGDTIAGIAENTEHWLAPPPHESRVMFLTANWLDGSVPPPRCEADGCVLAARVGGSYCAEMHDCKHPSGCSRRRASLGGVVVFCDVHRCVAAAAAKLEDEKDVACPNPRLENSEACEHHACPAFCETHECMVWTLRRPSLRARGSRVGIPVPSRAHQSVFVLR
ncbi:hypothetical protein CTAYLR_003527 [Chrysophaeum taylorii]|uniref:C3H1-type domain-containing protein n=1 Tax=Chrysophaeum taylorii TaxID=2483200 RepID=A0AAD7XL02_9STRA|nr:hypothetical protein CTAYLR_003527 [Chrysophaeum taylorii]